MTAQVSVAGAPVPRSMEVQQKGLYRGRKLPGRILCPAVMAELVGGVWSKF